MPAKRQKSHHDLKMVSDPLGKKTSIPPPPPPLSDNVLVLALMFQMIYCERTCC